MSILTLAMYAKVMKCAYFGTLKEKWKTVKEVPFFMKLSMIILSIICIAGGFLLVGTMEGFLGSAQEVLSRGTEYASTILQRIN